MELFLNLFERYFQLILDDKIQEIKNSIDQAEKIKNDAQITLSEIKKRQNEVKGEIDLIQARS